jgi:hypothetical protein
MGERICKLKIKREKEFLYYVKSDEEGYLEMWKTIMKRGGKRKKRDNGKSYKTVSSE